MSKRSLAAIVLGAFVALAGAPVWAADTGATTEKPAATMPAPKHKTAHKAAPHKQASTTTHKKSTTHHKTTAHKAAPKTTTPPSGQ